MKNIEKYTNTKDALEAYNQPKYKNVPLDVGLEAEEAYDAFIEFCKKSYCYKCRFASNSSTCALSWVYAKAVEEEAK